MVTCLLKSGRLLWSRDGLLWPLLLQCRTFRTPPGCVDLEQRPRKGSIIEPGASISGPQVIHGRRICQDLRWREYVAFTIFGRRLRKDASGRIVAHSERVWRAERNNIVAEHRMVNVTIMEAAVLVVCSRQPVGVTDYIVQNGSVRYGTAYSWNTNVAGGKPPSAPSRENHFVL